MIYSIDELRLRVAPVAVKYKLPAVYLFGSYARNDAADDSDVDVLVDTTDSIVRSLFDMGGLYNDLCESIGQEIDLVTTDALEQESTKRRSESFIENVRKEMVKIYG